MHWNLEKFCVGTWRNFDLEHVKDIEYIRVQYAPVIARVCGFARGAAECKKPQTSVITGVYCTSMHPISDLLP